MLSIDPWLHLEIGFAYVWAGSGFAIGLIALYPRLSLHAPGNHFFPTAFPILSLSFQPSDRRRLAGRSRPASPARSAPHHPPALHRPGSPLALHYAATALLSRAVRARIQNSSQTLASLNYSIAAGILLRGNGALHAIGHMSSYLFSSRLPASFSHLP